MAKQTTHCAYTKACANVDAVHERLTGTNKVMCKPHLRVVAAAPVVASGGDVAHTPGAIGFSSGGRRRRSSWMEDTMALAGGRF